MTSASGSPLVESTEAAPAGGRVARTALDRGLELLVVAWGLAVAAFPLTDNSFLTHLATGRLILDRASVPSADPYTYTARGTDWTVQSWLVSVIDAAAEQSAGVIGLRLVVAGLCGGAAFLVWRLSDPCRSLIPRIAVAFGAMAILTGLWGERPYMVGVLGLGSTWLATEGRIDRRWLVPIYWVWANSHGSFPLGVALAVAVAVGRRLDREDHRIADAAVTWAVLGSLSSIVGPLGFRSLLFPLTALTRSDLLSQIVEWQPATFQDLDERLFLVYVAATLLALVRNPRWGLALPAVPFVIAAFMAQRNIVMAMMVLVPVLARSIGPVGELRIDRRSPLGRPVAAVGALLVAIVGFTSVTAPFGSLASYPVRAIAFLGDEPVPVVAPDIVGNLFTALDGEDAQVFNDDRVDMLPRDLVEDGLVLLRGRSEWRSVLERRGTTLVVWERRQPLASLLAADPGWRVLYSDTDWVVACRRGSCPAGPGRAADQFE